MNESGLPLAFSPWKVVFVNYDDELLVYSVMWNQILPMRGTYRTSCVHFFLWGALSMFLASFFFIFFFFVFPGSKISAGRKVPNVSGCISHIIIWFWQKLIQKPEVVEVQVLQLNMDLCVCIAFIVHLCFMVSVQVKNILFFSCRFFLSNHEVSRMSLYDIKKASVFNITLRVVKFSNSKFLVRLHILWLLVLLTQDYFFNKILGQFTFTKQTENLDICSFWCCNTWLCLKKQHVNFN